jgi:CheY-like chemotaxis protein
MGMTEDKKSILVIDDESDTLILLFDLLSAEGYSVLGSSSPLDAIEHVRRRTFDVVLADVRMPEMDGLELLQRIKQISPRTRVVLVSAFADDKMRAEALRRGGEAFLEKPFRGEDLLRVLERQAQGTT